MKVSQSGKDAEKTLRWLRWADADYRAARLTLRAGLLVQGAALSDTAVEKYLKSLFSHLGLRIPRSHRASELFKRIKEETASDLTVNESYLRLLEKAYALRYPDEVTEGFNLALNQVRLLAELDRTAKKITERFEIVRQDTKQKIPQILERAIQEKDEGILTDNVALNPSLTLALFSSPSRSYDVRMHKGILFETEYTSATVKDGPEYEVEGFTVVADRQYRVAYYPILQSPNSASVDGIAQTRVGDDRNS
jgi:HEPN domain-containing protein